MHKVRWCFDIEASSAQMRAVSVEPSCISTGDRHNFSVCLRSTQAHDTTGSDLLRDNALLIAVRTNNGVGRRPIRERGWSLGLVVGRFVHYYCSPC